MTVGGLFEAVEAGNIPRALELLVSGADPDETSHFYGWTSLHIAAREGKVNLARILVKHGATLDRRDKIGQTPLHRAAFWGQRDMVRYLLDQGADFTALDDVLQTPEELARNNGHRDLSHLFLQCYVALNMDCLTNISRDKANAMRQQFDAKRVEEHRRREMRVELQRQSEREEKLRERNRIKEERLKEKLAQGEVQAEQVRADMKKLTSIPSGMMTKKELTHLRSHQEKLKQVEHQLDQCRLKLNKIRRAHLQRAHGGDKGTAWVEFINNM